MFSFFYWIVIPLHSINKTSGYDMFIKQKHTHTVDNYAYYIHTCIMVYIPETFFFWSHLVKEKTFIKKKFFCSVRFVFYAMVE